MYPWLTIHARNHKDNRRCQRERERERGLLSWHFGIPQEEFWIKVGGDPGKNSLRLVVHQIHVVYREHPN